MPVGAHQAAFGELANEQGIPLVPGGSFAWLTGRAHMAASVQPASGDVLPALAAIHAALGGSTDLLANKQERKLTVDFTLGESTIVEFDEPQHFTSARFRSLEFYGRVDHGLDVEEYERLCQHYRGSSDRYRANKPAADFPFPGGRHAQRAFLDSVRDLLAPAHGVRVIRIPFLAGSIGLAVESLLQRVSQIDRPS